jgi:hypothetical protein
MSIKIKYACWVKSSTWDREISPPMWAQRRMMMGTRLKSIFIRMGGRRPPMRPRTEGGRSASQVRNGILARVETWLMTPTMATGTAPVMD